MRLLVVTNDFPPSVGGIENYTYSLVKRWPGDDVTVVTRQVEGAEEFDRSLAFQVIREPVGTLIPTPDLYKRLQKFVSEKGIDMVHFPSCLPLGMMGPRLGVPYAVSVHGGEFLFASRMPALRGALKRVCRGSAVVLPQSSFAEGIVRNLLGDEVNLRRVTCGVDAERYGKLAAPPALLKAVGPVILSVSRLIIRKGVRTLIRCLPMVRRRHPEAHLLVVGDGPDLDTLKRMARREGLNGSVTFAGARPWEEMPSYYSAGDIFALPTRSRLWGTETEGLPLVYVEAAAAGLPLVGGNVGGVIDAVRDGENGFLVDGSSANETAEALLELIEDPEKAGRFGAAARKMVLEEFAWDQIAEHYRLALTEHCS
jgi:phosphatidyl-myo-inositol dimannoside synthase